VFPIPSIPEIPIWVRPSCKPNPTDLAADVLEAMTRKLADYDRLSAALTSAQEAATRNLERARLAENERNTYRVAAELEGKEVDAVRGALRAASGESAADAAARVMRERDEARLSEQRRPPRFVIDETPAPRPKLTPLRHVRSTATENTGARSVFSRAIDYTTHEFSSATVDVWNVGDRIEKWRIDCRGDRHTHVYAEDASPIRAHADANAVLARYGFVLERWP
jgi:hypothetical protein